MGGWPPIIGGLSIPYVTIPTNNRPGITMGGTRYFMGLFLSGEAARRRGSRRTTIYRRVWPPPGKGRRATLWRVRISYLPHWRALDRVRPPACALAGPAIAGVQLSSIVASDLRTIERSSVRAPQPRGLSAKQQAWRPRPKGLHQVASTPRSRLAAYHWFIADRGKKKVIQI